MKLSMKQKTTIIHYDRQKVPMRQQLSQNALLQDQELLIKSGCYVSLHLDLRSSHLGIIPY